jgi:arylsulfatase A-like enzyme
MIGKWHVGLGVPLGKPYNATHVLTGGEVVLVEEGEGENMIDWWDNTVIDGPNDFGFDSTYFTAASVGKGPYSFFRNGYLETKPSDIVFWEKGEYNTTRQNGISKIHNSCQGDKNWDSTAYNMILVNETIKFLNEHLETRRSSPFFAYVALGSVHVPHSPPLRYLDGSPIAGQYHSPHLDLLLEMDKVIGSLIGAIEEKGMANNTIFIFTSDNGGLNMNHPNQTLKGHKNTIWEGGHRVPLVMRYDGVFPKGEKRGEHFVGLNDLYATLADLVNLTVPQGSAQDSLSFRQYIESEKNINGLHHYLATYNVWMGRLKGQAIRYGDLKLVETYDKLGSLQQRSLYDLKKDIHEKQNIIHLDQYKSVVDRMSAEMTKLGLCPEDHVGEFKLISGKEVTCMWFEKHPDECDREIIGELNCHSICGRHNEFCIK